MTRNLKDITEVTVLRTYTIYGVGRTNSTNCSFDPPLVQFLSRENAIYEKCMDAQRI